MSLLYETETHEYHATQSWINGGGNIVTIDLWNDCGIVDGPHGPVDYVRVKKTNVKTEETNT